MAVYKTDANKNLIKVAGNYGGSKITLLWTNPSPSSAFAGQVVSVDLTKYDLALIIFKWDSGSTDTGSITVPKGWSGYVGAPYTMANRYQRTIGDVQDTYIDFGDGVVGGGFNNIACCPLYIYGIKVG